MPAKATDDDESLKRLGGGRWQTRDERFTIEPQSGTWAVVDSKQTDDLGLSLVRGPFPSLTAAKAAIASARTSEPATSPLAGRIGRDDRPKGKPDSATDRTTRRSKAGPKDEEPPASPTRSKKPAEPEELREPGWLADLSAADRGRARRLIASLTDAGQPDPEGVVRRDLVGGVPAIAAVAVSRALDALGGEASPDEVAKALADGRDDALGVRWRLVDGDGRPILLDRPDRRRRR